jgi:uncharacterized protein YcbK (DUF882 family)
MKLSTNFTKSEFESRCGSEMPASVLANVRVLAGELQKLRDALGGPRVTVASGYRSPKHNARIGGARASRHMTGTAADIKVNGFTPAQVAAKIEELIKAGVMYEGGLKAYPTFVHYDFDVTGRKRRW